MSDERDETPAQPLPKAEGEDTGVIPVPESTFGHARLHGWRLVGSLAALAGAGAVAWTWLFAASPDHDAAPGARMSLIATAYCKGTTTAAGTAVRRGIAAADRDVLPPGSVVSLSTGDPDFDGVYTVLDTGPAVQGRVLDLYVWSCHEALAFGRRTVSAEVLRLGWDPRDSVRTLTDRLLHRRVERRPEKEDAPDAEPADARQGPTSPAAAPVAEEPAAVVVDTVAPAPIDETPKEEAPALTAAPAQ
jgi:3D (Asp-Asp-Asp) domain-containing protein